MFSYIFITMFVNLFDYSFSLLFINFIEIVIFNPFSSMFLPVCFLQLFNLVGIFNMVILDK